MPHPDENLNIYMLPVGEGDSTIIQCPTGNLTFLNMGSMYTHGYWSENDIEKFIGNIELVKQIIISRPHPSHYNLLPIMFENTELLKRVYVTCSLEKYADDVRMKRWLDKINKENKLIEIKSQTTGNFACLGEDCPSLKLCSDSPFFESRILAANLGGCSGKDGDMKSDSLVLQVKFYDFSMLLPGDLQDPSTESVRITKQVIASVSDAEDLQATVYQASDHGQWEKANKYFFINAIKPKYVVINNAVPRINSSNEYTPRCELLYYLAHREGGSVLNLDSTQSFQCVWEDGSLGKLDETTRALFLTAFDVNDYKVRRILHISSDGEKHKVSHIPLNLP
eukprot:gene7463-8286_t